MTSKKYEIWVNGKYLEIHKLLSEAEARVRIYERQDRYEVSIGYGFPNGLPQYEIREA